MPSLDALAEILKSARLSGGVFFHAEFSAPWCLAGRMTPELCAPFLGASAHLIPYHYVSEGEVVVGMAGQANRTLRGGEVVIFPHNHLHLMGSDVGLPPASAAEIVLGQASDRIQAVRYGGGGAPASLVCGYLGCGHLVGNPIVSALPESIVLRVDDTPAADWIRSTIQYAVQEAASGGQGSAGVMTKLSELLFVEAVREHVRRRPGEGKGWIAGLRDPAIARTLALMHGDIAYPWSVEELGRRAGLSRSSLSERFADLVGVSPMHYLADWRLLTAGQMLRETTDSLARIAERVGYEAEAAFSRAFKRKFGSAPATWRRGQRADAQSG